MTCPQRRSIPLLFLSWQLFLLTSPEVWCPGFFLTTFYLLGFQLSEVMPSGSSISWLYPDDFRIWNPACSSPAFPRSNFSCLQLGVFPDVSFTAQILFSSPSGANSLQYLVPILFHTSDKMNYWPFPKHSLFIQFFCPICFLRLKCFIISLKKIFYTKRFYY